MLLYIIRHAWAYHYGDPRWPDDTQRPLSEKGCKRFTGIVDCMVERGFAPQIIATSPLVRCRQTADLVAEGILEPADVVELDALEPGSDLEALLAWTAEQAQRYAEVAWVGHAPDVGRLVAALTGDGEGEIHFAKGGVAAVVLEDPPEPGQGELRWLVTAKVLGVE